jgi:hypothetical protein
MNTGGRAPHGDGSSLRMNSLSFRQHLEDESSGAPGLFFLCCLQSPADHAIRFVERLKERVCLLVFQEQREEVVWHLRAAR